VKALTDGELVQVIDWAKDLTPSILIPTSIDRAISLIFAIVFRFRRSGEDLPRIRVVMHRLQSLRLIRVHCLGFVPLANVRG
jgi:hypothetical protein